MMLVLPTLEVYRLHDAERLLTPALLVYPEIVDANIDATLRMTAEEELFRVTVSLPAEMAEAPKQSAEDEPARAKEVRA